VKEWLKSVLNYRSYPKIKLGIRFLDHPIGSFLPVKFREDHPETPQGEKPPNQPASKRNTRFPAVPVTNIN